MAYFSSVTRRGKINFMDGQADFTGTDRYEVIRLLGRGSFGVVYEVHDRVRRERVALKTLNSVDGDAVFYIKKEFRSVSDISHPNLVSLYELSVAEGLWYFTMELVDGTNLVEYFHGTEASPYQAHDSSVSFWDNATIRDADPGEVGSNTGAAGRSGKASKPLLDEKNLRSVLTQVILGILALHRAGVVHRDIKPSNVLVTPKGVVKIADFGLSVKWTDKLELAELSGTPGYIAPELFLNGRSSPESDWYSVGVILYEVLTGRRPFARSESPSSYHGVLPLVKEASPTGRGAVFRECISVELLAPDAPEDLSALCMELIELSPSRRPDGEEILHRIDPTFRLTQPASFRGHTIPPAVDDLCERPTENPDDPQSSSDRESMLLIGRAREADVMRQAHASAREGSTVVLRVAGNPGVGKSALVEQFLSSFEGDGETLVLRGRCFERESLPYRGVDSLMDSLSSYLRNLETAEVTGLVPRDASALVKVFPVMSRVEAMASAPSEEGDIPDKQELRHRAFRGLRELLTRLTTLHPLVLWLDDLQWSDRDSAALLADIFGPPDPPLLLLVASYRNSEQGLPPDLDRALSSANVAGRVEQLTLSDLSPEHALELARIQLDATPELELAEAVAAESRGNPLFIIMLAAHVIENGDHLDQHITLEEMVDCRMRSLTPEARRLLSVASLSHRQPLPLTIAQEAAQLESGTSEVLELLRAQLMLDTCVGDGDGTLQLSHDRIREGVVAGLDSTEQREHHRQLARALEACQPPDHEALASHLLGAGETKAASQALILAAGLASEKLAFDRAAFLYGQALELGEVPRSEERQLRVLHGDSLRNAGRGPEAAREYLDAVAGATKSEALELRRRAVEQLLLSGHTIEGKRLMRTLLREQGIEARRTRIGVLLDIGVSQSWIRIRELYATERAPETISAETKQRLDVAWSTTWGLSLIEPVEARALQCRHILDALKVGDPFRLARALMVEVAMATSLDELQGKRRRSVLIDRSKKLVEQLDHPYTTGFWGLVNSMRLFFSHQFAESLREGDQATAYLRAHCTGVAAELMTLRLFRVCSLYYLGEFAELSRRVQAALRTTRASGDLVGVASVSGGVPLTAWLVDDDLETARSILEESRRQLGRNRFSHGDYWEMFGEGFLSLYAGEQLAGYKQLRSRWGAFVRSGINLMPSTIVPTLHLRGALAVAAAKGRRHFRAHRDALSCARKLDGYAWLPGALAMASLIRAAVEYQRGHRIAALDLLETAEKESRSAGMAWYAEVARLRSGSVLGGATGAALESEAWRELANRRIARPDRFARLIAPGFPEPRPPRREGQR